MKTRKLQFKKTVIRSLSSSEMTSIHGGRVSFSSVPNSELYTALNHGCEESPTDYLASCLPDKTAFCIAS